MASERIEGKIGDLFDLVSGYAFKSSEFIESGVPVIKIKNVKAGQMVYDNLSFVSERFRTSRPDKIIKDGDLLITMSGNRLNGTKETWVGKVAQFRNSGTYFLNQRVGILRPKPGVEIERRYFNYALSSDFYQNEFIAIATSSGGQANLSPSQILGAPLSVLPLPEQKTIARILGTLDDKIELNRRMNETLEAMARALFQSWFVDFDPVHAKAAGRPPSGMDEKTAALFPASFQNSALGDIPAGWNVIPLYDTAQWVNGAAFKTSDFCSNGEGLPIIKIAELKDGIGAQTKWSQRAALPQKTIDTGDLLYSWSGSPETSLEAFLWSGSRGLLNQHIFKVISPTTAEKRFVYYLLQYLRPVLVETAKNKQTTGLGHVTIADMKRLLVCMPNKAVLAAFDRIVAPIFDRAFNNTLESRTLATLRDTLLPKLLSGDLNVKI